MNKDLHLILPLPAWCLELFWTVGVAQAQPDKVSVGQVSLKAGL